MSHLILKRIHSSHDGTFGVLIDDVPFCVTLELPWYGNKENVSCVPSGNYTCVRIRRPSGEETFRLLNVPGRTDILIHRANTVKNLKGCIGVGEEYGALYGQPAIIDSGQAFRELMARLKGLNMFKLEILEYT